MSQQLMHRPPSVPAELQEKVLLGGDLSKLTPTERLSYYNAVCESVHLNPLTRPFEYLMLGQGEEKRMVLYARKDCTDQLRDLHGISVEIVSREVIDGVCVVTARAKNMTERTDESVGAVPFMSENGEWKRTDGGKAYFKPDGTYRAMGLAERSNAMMKAETKAKRRVTLSICGLGMFDESEMDTMPDAKILYHAENETPKTRAEILDRVPALPDREQDGLEAALPKGSDMSPASQDAAPAGAPTQRLNEALDHYALLDPYRQKIRAAKSPQEATREYNATPEELRQDVWSSYQEALKGFGKKK